MVTASEQLLDSLSTLRRSLRRRLERPHELSDLTGAQLELVRLLRRRPGLSVADAAGELGLAANTVSTLVGRLADAGVVVRRVGRDDRRTASLELVPGVRRRVEAWRDSRVELLAAALEGLDDEERRRVLDALPGLARLASLVEDAGPRRPSPTPSPAAASAGASERPSRGERSVTGT